MSATELKMETLDASVMPTIPRGNVHAPCVMIGERAAELISAVQGRERDEVRRQPGPERRGRAVT
ncbi:hypothetical protein ABGB18_38830 [Nonomuraea sp. B12E4]|uniref:hypothetical protein n=1 Tax=Nonomuraea sp. B12E4 TaxID=3153564 RepID=UPI00325C6DE6